MPEKDLNTYPVAELDEPEQQDDVSGNTPSEDESMEKITAWWEYDEEARRPITAEFEQIYLMYSDKHWDMDGPTGDPLRTEDEKLGRPNVVENVAFTLVEGVKSEFSQEVELIDYPVEKNDDAAAKIMTNVKRHVLDKNDFGAEYGKKWLHNFCWYGTAVWGPRWDAEWRGGRGPNQWIGEIRVESIHPAMLYPDHRCGEDIQDGVRIHKAMWKPLEYIHQHFPERGHLVLDHNRQDSIVTETIDSDEYGASLQDGMARLIETWYAGKPLFSSKDAREDEDEEAEDAEELGDGALPPSVAEGDTGEVDEAGGDTPSDDETGLHVVWWIAEQNIYLAHKNFMYFEPDETPLFPFEWSNCYPREDSPWGFGEGHKLLDPQQKINKLSEIAMEGSALQALGFTLADEEAVTESQRREIELYGSIPGMWFFVSDPDRVKHISGQGIPASLLSDIARRTKHMESLVGRYDISQGKAPSDVTAFRALNLLAERAQVRLRPKEQTIHAGLVGLSRWMSRLIMLHYNEPRAYRIMGKSDEDVQFGQFQPQSMWRAWDRRNGNVFERNKFVPEEGMVEGKDYDFYWPEFDTRCAVTKAASTDRYFAMEVARDLIGAKLILPEHLWFTLENGRLPPWETISEQVNAQFQQAQPQPMPGQPQGQPQGVPQGAPQEMDPEALIAMLSPEQQAEIAALPPEAQQQVLTEMMSAMQGGG